MTKDFRGAINVIFRKTTGGLENIMTLYLKTTKDEYELPIAVADSPTELALILGTTPGCVSSSLSHKRAGWCKVEVGDDEDGN